MALDFTNGAKGLLLFGIQDVVGRYFLIKQLARKLSLLGHKFTKVFPLNVVNIGLKFAKIQYHSLITLLLLHSDEYEWLTLKACIIVCISGPLTVLRSPFLNQV